MKKHRILCLMLALAMLVSLTACQIEIPGVGTVNIKDGNLPNIGGNAGGNHGGDDVDGANIEGDYDDSIDLLRKEMNGPSYMVAAAFIGSSAGGPDDLELPLSEWIQAETPDLCAKYTFIRQIPRERVVGNGGSLFCVVPRDPNATLAVNRIRWNPQNEAYDNLEVLYRGESGEPILLYACADMGESPYPDTEVIVTDSKGKTMTWYPIYGLTILPYDFENDAPMGYDFTDYSGEFEGGDVDGDVRWTAPTMDQLTEYTWTWQGDYENKPAMATMSLTKGSSTNNITFKWWYLEDQGNEQEIYEGNWKLTDGGRLMDLTMTRTGGQQYKKGESAKSSIGVFMLQVPELFDIVPVLNVAGGEDAGWLPIQQIPNELLMFNPAQG